MYYYAMKTILITAGGTAEPIDNIRSITNTGTGMLGSLIADRFAQEPEVERIIYVHGHRSVLPKTEKAICIEASHTKLLQETIRKVCAEYHPDAIIHSMAISDFTVASVVRLEEIERIHKTAEVGAQYYEMEYEDALIETAKNGDLRNEFAKIPSSVGNPVIFLEPTPKIIPELRKLAPDAVIVGFKLLDEVSHDELMDVAKRLMEKNDCDFVLANDYQTVQAGASSHVGHLMARGGSVESFVGKEAIADGIARAVMAL